MSYTILIADDEKEIIDFLTLYLEKEGFRIVAAGNGQEAWRLLNQEQIDLALLDIMMPHINGYELLKKIRAEGRNLPVIMLSAKGENADKILGLGLGADDYITKPFDPLEVTARVQANIRRFYHLGADEASESACITVRDLELNMEECALYKNGTAISLTSIEYKILKLFMKHPGKVFTKKQIYEAAWEDDYIVNDYIVDDNNIMVYISRLREKLGETKANGYIQTIRGLGYKMVP